MHDLDLMLFVNLLFTGVLAGFEIGVHYGLGSPPRSLREDAQIRLRQAMVLRLRVLAPAIFLPALLSTVLLAFRSSHGQHRWLYVVALGALLCWIFIRAIRTVPVNTATLAWNPDAPPVDWRRSVEATERFHVIAAWAAVFAFGSCLAAVL